MEKFCRKCQTNKSEVEFSKNQSQCKNCKKEHYNRNKHKWDRYYKKNLKQIREYNKKWNLENQEKIKTYNEGYNVKNQDKINQEFKIWYQNNPNYYKNRYKNDINFKLKSILRARISQALKGNMKEQSSINLLGCTITEYKKYLSNQFDENMSWENYGDYWEIDHIKPCDSFDLSRLEEQKKCFIFTNTQPLEKIQNRKKSNKLCN